MLKKKGVKSIVVLLHEGGFPADPKAYNSCPGISGPVVDINAGLDPEIDAIISGHTHQAYNCSLLDSAEQPRLVTSASSFGRLVTEVRLSIDNATGDVDRREHAGQQPDRHPGRGAGPQDGRADREVQDAGRRRSRTR